MSGVTIREYGLRFVWVCLRNYLGKSWPILLIFVLGMLAGLFLLLRGRQKKDTLRIVTLKGAGQTEDVPSGQRDPVTVLFCTVAVVCALTVYNPFLVKKIIPKLGMTTVYYRFFWILPITFGAAYYLVQLLFSLRSAVLRFFAALACSTVLAFVLPVNPGLLNLHIPTNVYKVDGAIPVLSEAIHEDFEKTPAYRAAVENLAQTTEKTSKKWLKARAKTYPVCVFPYQLEFAVRQYDPTLRLTFNRNLRLFYEGNQSTGITYGEKNKRYQRRALILDALYGKDASITREDFQTAMRKTKTDYLICEESKANGTFLVQAGCTQVGVVAGYTIFRYDR